MNVRKNKLREEAYLASLSACVMKAEGALRDVLLIPFLLLLKTEGKGGKPFGLTEVEL